MHAHRTALLAACAGMSLVLVAAVVHAAPARATAAPTFAEYVFTPVVVHPLRDRYPAVQGTDGLMHVVYELELTNTKPAAATLERMDVLDADHPGRVLASYTGKTLLGSLRTLQPAPAASAVIPFNATRLFYVELALKRGDVPRAVTQRFHLLAAANPGPTTPATALEYLAGAIDIDAASPVVLAPPLRGPGWVAANGCCNSGIVHRGSILGINGRLYDAQRFAIDWMRVNAHGELVHGDPGDVHNHVDFGAPVHAVADGTVVEVLDDLPDQIPGKLPDPASMSLATIDGNHVIEDIAHGHYVLYAHLRRGSITVARGRHVNAGDVIGELGNSGNTSAPHLHVQLTDGPLSAGSEGLPYVIGSFTLAGHVDAAKWQASDALTGHWAQPLAKPLALHERFPLNLDILDFPGR